MISDKGDLLSYTGYYTDHDKYIIISFHVTTQNYRKYKNISLPKKFYKVKYGSTPLGFVHQYRFYENIYILLHHGIQIK